MNILGTIGELIRKDEISEYLTVSASDGKDVLFFEEEMAIGSLLRFNALSGASDQTQIALNTVCNEKYPAGTIMQIIQFGSPNLEQTVHQYTKLRDIAEQQHNTDSDNSRDFCIDSTRSRAQAFLDFTRDRVVPSSDVRLTETNSYWTLKIPLTIKEFLGTQKELDQIQREIEDFKIMRARLMSQLQTAGIQSYPVETAEYLAIMRRYFDVYGDWDWRWDPQEQLCDQIMPPGSHIKWTDKTNRYLHLSGFADNEKHQRLWCGMLAIDSYPKSASLAEMFEMTGDPSGTGPQIGMPYALCTTIHYPDAMIKEQKIRKGQVITDRQAFGPMLRWSESLRHKYEGFALMGRSIADGDAPVEVGTTLTLFNRSRNEIHGATARIIPYYNSLGWRMRQERYLVGVSFFNQLPLSPSPTSILQTHRYKTMSGTHAAQFLPVLDEWQGSGAAVLLSTRRGRAFGLDFYAPENPNFNWAVIADSGSGKSFLLQRLQMDYVSLGCKVWNIDSGGSSARACMISGGEVLSLHRESKVSLNPFTKVQDIDDEMSMIIALLGKMVEPDDKLKAMDAAIFMEAIKSCWSHKGPDMEIGDLIQYLNNQTPEKDRSGRALDLAKLLMPFGPIGSYGSWFKGANNFRADASWTVLELSDLKTNPHLQAVVLMQLVNAIKQEMYLARDGRKRMLIVEEAGERLRTDPGFAGFMSEAYSQVRKEAGSIGLVLQSLSQMFNHTKDGETIMANCPSKLLMHQTAETLNAAERNEWLNLNAYQRSIARQVHTVKGQYSEIAVFTPGGSGIARLVEGAYNQALFTTEGPAFHEVMKALRKGATPHELHELIERYSLATDEA
ncbi:TraC family protein [Ottowia thiooxydans]|uniref:TraC family protein n=1 Tax=Ottowia thiooxydans TaxID=219182 RepID=UPI0003F4F825|nr:TraC family protein [Ottowia thiooxydans]